MLKAIAIFFNRDAGWHISTIAMFVFPDIAVGAKV